jgi:hypothetical protein
MPPIWKRDEGDEKKGGRHGERTGIPCVDDIYFFSWKNIEEEEDRTVPVALGAALEDAEYAWMVRSLHHT